MTSENIVIVGGGVYGVSLTLAILEEYPGDQVYLIDEIVDHKADQSASRGIGRIIRDKYDGIDEYESLASKSMAILEDQFPDFLHKTGRRVLEPGLMQDGSRKTLKDVEFENITDITDDTNASWVEAGELLKHLTDTARQKGAQLRTGRAINLLWQNSKCVGVELDNRSQVHGKVILSMGYKLPKFLEDQGLPLETGLCKIVLVPWCTVELNKEEAEKFQHAPIIVVPGIGEYIVNGQTLWVNNATTAEVKDLDKLAKSYPLGSHSPYYQETRSLLGKLLPQLKEKEILFHYCIDLITKTQDFLIRKVAGREDLYIMGGGGLHGFKFISVIGKEVLRLIKTKNDFDPRGIWSGKFQRETGVHSEVMPRRIFPDE